MFVERFGGSAPTEAFSWPGVQGVRDSGEVVWGSSREVGALGEVLAQEPVSVLVRATLPRAARVGKVDLQACVDRELGVAEISLPRSHVSERLSSVGSVPMAFARARFIEVAP